MQADWTVDRLLNASPNPNEALLDGKVIVRTDRFPVQGARRLRLTFEHVDSQWPQAVYLSADRGLLHNGAAVDTMTFWADRCPCEVPIALEAHVSEVFVSNAWDPTGTRYPERWHSAGAMSVDEIDSGRRYRCNDGFPDQDFTDLVFTLVREQEEAPGSPAHRGPQTT